MKKDTLEARRYKFRVHHLAKLTELKAPPVLLANLAWLTWQAALDLLDPEDPDRQHLS